MTLEEKKKLIRDGITYEIGKSKRPIGGQQCGMEILPVILKCEELSIEISINAFRANHKNRELGITKMKAQIKHINFILSQ